MIAELATIIPHILPIIGTLLSALFMFIIIAVLMKALQATDVRGLFMSQDEQGGISLTKFWQNVAYGAATVAFLSLNISSTTSNTSLEIVWVIYLGVVASNAVLSKWISMKYNQVGDPSQDVVERTRSIRTRSRRVVKETVAPDSPD